MPAGIPVTAFCRVGGWSPRPTVVLVVAAAFLAGCEQDEPILVETVPKDTAAQTGVLKPTPPSDRMLAAIVPHGEAAYFFKLTGPIDKVAELRPEFLGLLRSLTFKDGEPSWQLPAGWSQNKGGPGRIATITVPDNPPFELAVSSLRLPEKGLSEYLLANVNRWRKQMGLADVAPERLESAEDPEGEIFRFELSDGTEVTLVDFAGRFSGGMTPPFAGQAASAPAAPSSPSVPKLSYDLPEGWRAAPGDGISTAAFSSGSARTTVTALPATNELLPNVNRWRTQVGLEPIGDEELADLVKTIELGDGEAGDYVVLSGPADGESPTSILGVVAVRDGTAWFVKMTGDSPAVLDQQGRFEAFVNSIRFSPESE